MESSNQTLIEENGESRSKLRVYKKRWFILAVFAYYAAINNFQWIEYSSITHIVVKYYGTSSLAVDWTSTIYLALYPIWVIPASYITDKKGIRATALIGCIGTAVGTGIKVFSIQNDLFYIVLLGQIILASSYDFIICLIPKIAAVWFKPNELSTSCALGMFGLQLGSATGYIVPSLIVKDHDNVDLIGSDLKLLCCLLTAAILPVTIAVMIYFPNQPHLPPSITQASLRENKPKFSLKEFFLSLKKLMFNEPFVIHMTAYGINVGVVCAVYTLLNQFILQYFEGDNEHAGTMGFVMVTTGMAGTVLVGVFMDQSHKYKEMTVFANIASAVSLVALMYALEWRSKCLTYISCATVGLCLSAYMQVGFELSFELTFPIEESTTTGILMTMTQVLGVIFTVALGHFNQWARCYWSLASQVVLLLIGAIITGFVPNRLLRQEALQQNNEDYKVEAVKSVLIE